jgi:hypothetical protein
MDHSVLYSSQDHLKTGICDLDHPILPGAKNTDRTLIPTLPVLQSTGS